MGRPEQEQGHKNRVRVRTPEYKQGQSKNSRVFTLTQIRTGAVLILLILITGIVVGMLPGILKLDKMFSITNIVVGFVGALVGAFLGFGDAPLFLKYPFLHEKTLMIAVSFLFVFIKVAVKNRRGKESL
jgi:uncharacterized membrane protein YeaQ/YmgE (transglycosylase-associated protein family)